jgi:hypothetical protein
MEKSHCITQIKKKGEKELAKNCRPMSLTCILCKVIETIIREIITSHMRTNDLLSPKQFGFLNGRSTQLQLLITTEFWQQALDEGYVTYIVYMDNQKAFNTVPARRLL